MGQGGKKSTLSMGMLTLFVLPLLSVAYRGEERRFFFSQQCDHSLHSRVWVEMAVCVLVPV